jgi:hypothetical protein
MRLHSIAHEDWKNSHPLDLTDEGLISDLENKGDGGEEKLALNVKKKNESDEV